jgi:Mce-associated membrane protein
MTDQTRDTRDIETTAAVEDDAEATEKPKKQESPTRTKRPRREWSRVLGNVKLVPVILVVLLLISGGSAAWLYFKQYKPAQQTNPDVARTVVSAASDGTVALLSYSPESLDKDFAAAKSHLTGDFLSYYNQFTQEIVAPAAKQKSLKTTANVMGAAVSELRPDSAVVLVFVDQSTTSKDKPDPSMAASNVLVSLTRVNDHWLIAKFDPI